MELFRIIDKTGVFVRDDFTWNEETEIALEIEPPNDEGFIHPKWTGTEWIEGATQIPTPAAEPQKSDEELLQELSLVVQQLKERGLI